MISFKECLKRRKFRKLLLRTKNWKKVRDNPSIKVTHFDLLSDVISQPLTLGKVLWRIFTPKIPYEQAELAIRQRIVSLKLNNELLPTLVHNLAEPKTENIFAVPHSWRKKLGEEGVSVAHWSSGVFWSLFVLRTFVRTFKAIWRLAFNVNKMPFPTNNSYAVLLGLTQKSAQTMSAEGSQLSAFSSWYCASLCRLETETQIWSQVETQSFHHESGDNWITPGLFPALPRVSGRVRYLIIMLCKLLIAGVAMLCGRWQAVFLAEEAASLDYITILGRNAVASTYVFNNANFIYRPLWTCLAEVWGSRIYMAFYSTNSSPFQWRSGEREPLHPFWKLSNWPDFLVWDEDHETFIRQISGSEPGVKHVGIIPLEDSGAAIPDLPDNAIAVFDIPIYRDVALSGLGYIVPYYDVNTLHKFLFDAWEAITSSGNVMVLKKKRDIHTMAHRGYIKSLDELSKRDGVLILESSISARRLISNVKATVSIPYTSTAVISNLTDVPCVYYDAANVLKKSGPELHNVPLITNYSELKTWLENI